MGNCYSCVNKKPSLDNRRTQSGDSEHALLDRFGSGQIEMLRSKFKEYEHNGGLDIAGFKKIMPYISKLPGDIIENAFNLFRNSTKDRISWTSFCATVSQYILGTRQEKCRFLYDVFDKKHRGMLTKDEIALLNKHLFEVLKTPVTSSINVSNLLEKCVKSVNVLKFADFRDWAIDNIDLHKALQPFEIIPSAVTEKEIYLKYQTEMKIKGYIPGESYYIISKNWLEAWKNYVRFNFEDEVDDVNDGKRFRSTSFKSGARPIEIRNNEIIDPDCKLRLLPNMRENAEFEILSKEAWIDLHKWYSGGPEIMREAVQGNDLTYVEIYPPVLKVYYKKNNAASLSKDPILYLVNVFKTVGFVIEELKKRIQGEGELSLTLQIGDKFTELDPEQNFNYYKLNDINICSFEVYSENKEHSIVLEETLKFNIGDAVEYLENGYWMSGIIQNIIGNEYTIGASWHNRTIKINKTEISSLRKPPMTPLSTKSIAFSTGLANIGNTCYMNSILQCFAHSPLINQYFTGESYADLKRKCGINSKLKIVEEVENLLNELRTSKELKIRPDRFYVEMTKVHKQFQGFEQHDSHEFLGILLHSLHEDLKYSHSAISQTITLKGVNNEEERKFSQDQWEKYRGMHGSVISAICGGQTRNCLSCRNCTEKNTIFEVFTDFSIPIPIKDYDYSLVIIIVPRMSIAIQKILVHFNKNDEIEVFLKEIETKSGLSSSRLTFAFIEKGYFHDTFQPLLIEEIIPKDGNTLHAFELLTTIEEIEGLGRDTIKKRKPEDWRTQLSVDDYLDVLYNQTWKVGKIKEVHPTKYLVQVQIGSGELTYFHFQSSNIAYFRHETTNSNTILNIPIFHCKLYRNIQKFLGTPQIISIGTWYNWKYLSSALYDHCSLFADKKVKNIKKKVTFFIFKKSGRCVICKKKNCPGCEIIKSYDDLEELADIRDDIYIIASWSDEFSYKSVYIEEPDGIETCSIHDCFTKYTESEIIEKKCEECANTLHESQIEIWRLPDLLIIHLKRFSFRNSKFLKLNHLVKFPLVGLDMSFWMLNSKKKQGVTMKTTRDNYLYDLYAVVNHTGGISGGHYTSFSKVDNEKWLFFDDDRVFQVTGDIEEEIVTRKAYILFYKRQRFRSGNVVNTMSLKLS